MGPPADDEAAAAAGQDDPGAEHVDEQQREQYRLDGDIGQLQRLAPDVHEVAAGEHEDIGEPLPEADLHVVDGDPGGVEGVHDRAVT